MTRGTPMTVEPPIWRWCEDGGDMEDIWSMMKHDVNHQAWRVSYGHRETPIVIQSLTIFYYWIHGDFRIPHWKHPLWVKIHVPTRNCNRFLYSESQFLGDQLLIPTQMIAEAYFSPTNMGTLHGWTIRRNREWYPHQMGQVITWYPRHLAGFRLRGLSKCWKKRFAVVTWDLWVNPSCPGQAICLRFVVSPCPHNLVGFVSFPCS